MFELRRATDLQEIVDSLFSFVARLILAKQRLCGG